MTEEQRKVGLAYKIVPYIVAGIVAYGLWRACSSRLEDERYLRQCENLIRSGESNLPLMIESETRDANRR